MVTWWGQSIEYVVLVVGGVGVALNCWYVGMGMAIHYALALRYATNHIAYRLGICDASYGFRLRCPCDG